MSDAYMVAALMVLLFYFVVMVVIIGFFSLCETIMKGGRKSRQYRKLIMDMYVSAKLRQFAEEDKLDLEIEYQRFSKWMKLRKKEEYRMELDDTVEQHIQEKIEDSAEKKEVPKK